MLAPDGKGELVPTHSKGSRDSLPPSQAHDLLDSMPFQVQANNPSVYIAVAVLVGAGTVIAGYIPASRAAWIDPVIALRQ
jgi:ABC-type lipoprotein release transport system permease subunit